MDDTFHNMTLEDWVIIYMDDVFILTRTIAENIEKTAKILQRCREADLFVKPEKCEFWKQRVEYLGHIIEPDHVQMDPVKLGGLVDWPTPKTVKDVRSFLGFGNYYRRFIAGYGDLTRPFNDLLKKMNMFEWTKERQTAFETLKQKFQEQPILQLPDRQKPFLVETDASKYASGGIL